MLFNICFHVVNHVRYVAITRYISDILNCKSH